MELKKLDSAINSIMIFQLERDDKKKYQINVSKFDLTDEEYEKILEYVPNGHAQKALNIMKKCISYKEVLINQ